VFITNKTTVYIFSAFIYFSLLFIFAFPETTRFNTKVCVVSRAQAQTKTSVPFLFHLSFSLTAVNESEEKV